MKLWYWVRHPSLVFARVRYWLWEKRNADKPWLTPAAVAFLDKTLSSDMSGLEFGSGRSTGWFARKLARLTSIEHEAGWYKIVLEQLAVKNISNVEYLMVPLDHPEMTPEQDSYSPVPSYITVTERFPDDSLDFVVVDGHYRTNCILASLTKLKPGGLLLVDDANMWPNAAPPIPPTWPEVHRSGNGLKFTAIWRKPAA